MSLNDEIVYYISEKIKDNIRLIEGILNSLVANFSLLGREIDKNLVDEAIEKVYNKRNEEKKFVNLKRIMEVVCEYFGITPEEIKSEKRVKNIILPRQIAMYLSRDLTDSSLNSIAIEFNGKDHTTVLHACRKIKNLIEKDQNIKSIIENIKEKLNE